jgi:hypothetical protein
LKFLQTKLAQYQFETFSRDYNAVLICRNTKFTLSISFSLSICFHPFSPLLNHDSEQWNNKIKGKERKAQIHESENSGKLRADIIQCKENWEWKMLYNKSELTFEALFYWRVCLFDFIHSLLPSLEFKVWKRCVFAYDLCTQNIFLPFFWCAYKMNEKHTE